MPIARGSGDLKNLIASLLTRLSRGMAIANAGQALAAIPAELVAPLGDHQMVAAASNLASSAEAAAELFNFVSGADHAFPDVRPRQCRGAELRNQINRHRLASI